MRLADLLVERSDELLAANGRDMEMADKLTSSLKSRLLLSQPKIQSLVTGNILHDCHMTIMWYRSKAIG